MNLRHLKTLIAVAQYGNFARAANAVGLTQSAVSMQIKALETLLGAQLFDRSQRPAVLNERGKLLVRRAHEIVHLYDSLPKTAGIGPDMPGLLNLGAVRSSVSGIMPRALSALNHQFPNVRVSIVHALPGELIERVEQGELDGALVSEPLYLPPQLRWTGIMEEPLVVIAATEVQGDSFDELLSGNPYVALNRGDWGGRPIAEYLNRRGIVLRPIMEFDSTEAVIMAVQRKLGVSILHQGCIDHPLRGRLRITPFGDPPLTRCLGLLCRPTAPCSLMFEALVDILKRMSAEQCDIWWPLSA
ncbi:MAG TPA: LysR family transcriptional regulator [Pseudolabrys sp.]|nr:LysR family transcriptional regulator [Pseudolabrys sp.]